MEVHKFFCDKCGKEIPLPSYYSTSVTIDISIIYNGDCEIEKGNNAKFVKHYCNDCNYLVVNKIIEVMLGENK